MTRISLAFVFLSFVVVSCATHISDRNANPTPANSQDPFSNRGVDYVSVEVALDDNDLSFWDVPLREKAFISNAPEDRKDGLVVGELGIDAGKKDLIVTLAQEIAQGQHGKIDSLLISHNGKLLFESYYLRGRINLTHPQVSATKTYTTLVLGRAIQLGYLTMADLDKPVVSFLKDLDSSRFVEGAEKITLHQALNMRSGLQISDEQRAAFENVPGALLGQGKVQALFEHSAPITAESQRFVYQGSDPNLVMQVIEAVVPGSAEDFIKNELFHKLGISTYNWQNDVSGLPRAGDRASITSRAMARLGTLILNKGKWNGEQLLPEAFVEKAISRITSTGDEDVFGGGKDVSGQGYGYFLWNADLKHGDKQFHSVSAQGGGGQFIILIDEMDLMVVFTAHDGNSQSLQLTAERILPAFID